MPRPDTGPTRPFPPPVPTGQANTSGVADAYMLTDLLFDLLDSVMQQVADLQAQVDALNPPIP